MEEIKVLGSGACATVKSCYVNGWICAVKEINVEDTLNTEEIYVLEKLPYHRNFVRYFSHREINGKLQIFLKQYSGTLKGIIEERKKQQRPFKPREIVKILTDIACGLNFLHSHNVIHRGISFSFSLLFYFETNSYLKRYEI